jgi:hypothetical protein
MIFLAGRRRSQSTKRWIYQVENKKRKAENRA